MRRRPQRLEPLGNLVPAYFARRSPRDTLDEEKGAGPFVGLEAIAKKTGDVLLGQTRVRRENDRGTNHLAQRGMRDTECRRIGNFRMGKQRRIDLDRRYLLSA